jgi:SulP family sulfate permease
MLANLRSDFSYFARPIEILHGYSRSHLKPDFIAGLTVAVILLPQSIAYALIAGLPPEMGLYTAIVASLFGAMWGSSNQLQTGPTNTASLLVLSTLLVVAKPGTSQYLAAAGLMALMVGVFRLALGMAHLGMLVNFVSDSVIVGFTAGAGILIIISQLIPLFRLDVPSTPGLLDTLGNVGGNLGQVHLASLLLGLGVIVVIVIMKKVRPAWPGPLISMLAASLMVWIFGLSEIGVKVIGRLPTSLPPVTLPPVLDFTLAGQIFGGALAVGAIGLVEAVSVARSIASQTGQRLDSNQEFIGQGLACIVSSVLSGYASSGSFTRSAVNFKSGAQTPLASAFSGLLVLAGMFMLAPLGVYLPRAALAGVLMVIGYGMIDQKEMARIWRGPRGDAVIMVITIVTTLFLPLMYAVLSGILVSFAIYIIRTSTPRVVCVLPDDAFRHMLQQPGKPLCPQLAIFDIQGDLYFGAVNHVDKAIHDHLVAHPTERYLLLRMHSVNQCDISGIHALENILRTVRDQGGEIYLTRVQEPVLQAMQAAGFYRLLGEGHVLKEDDAIGYLYQRVLDPATCIYECEVRAFRECQSIPKRILPADLGGLHKNVQAIAPEVTARQLWVQLHTPTPPWVIDVREPREYRRGHIPQAEMKPLPQVLLETLVLPIDRPVVFVCQGGRRSSRAAAWYVSQGFSNVFVLQGGMLAWEAAGLLEAIEISQPEEESA